MSTFMMDSDMIYLNDYHVNFIIMSSILQQWSIFGQIVCGLLFIKTKLYFLL